MHPSRPESAATDVSEFLTDLYVGKYGARPAARRTESSGRMGRGLPRRGRRRAHKQ